MICAYRTILMTIIACATSGYAFVGQTSHRGGCSTFRRRESELRSSTERALDQSTELIDRRSLLITASSVTAGYFLREKIVSTASAPAILTTFESSPETGTIAPSVSTVKSVEEALNTIESSGDKRFLHAVVASDYKFLYEGPKTIPSEIDAEQIFSKKVPNIGKRSRSFVMATTGKLREKRSASLWPLESKKLSGEDIHYAWPEVGGLLRPNKNENDSPSKAGTTQKIIVDGIDCGKMSLEDALEGGMQVLVQAPIYLSVPSHMESSLRKLLQEAFLI